MPCSSGAPCMTTMSAPASISSCVHFRQPRVRRQALGHALGEDRRERAGAEDVIVLVHDDDVGVLTGLADALQNALRIIRVRRVGRCAGQVFGRRRSDESPAFTPQFVDAGTIRRRASARRDAGLTRSRPAPPSRSACEGMRARRLSAMLPPVPACTMRRRSASRSVLAIPVSLRSKAWFPESATRLKPIAVSASSASGGVRNPLPS